MMPKFKTPTEEIKHLQVSLERAHKGIKKRDKKLEERDRKIKELEESPANLTTHER